MDHVFFNIIFNLHFLSEISSTCVFRVSITFPTFQRYKLFCFGRLYASFSFKTGVVILFHFPAKFVLVWRSGAQMIRHDVMNLRAHIAGTCDSQLRTRIHPVMSKDYPQYYARNADFVAKLIVSWTSLHAARVRSPR